MNKNLMILALTVLAFTVPAQTNKYLYSGSEVTVTLNPGIYTITAYGAQGAGTAIMAISTPAASERKWRANLPSPRPRP